MVSGFTFSFYLGYAFDVKDAFMVETTLASIDKPGYQIPCKFSITPRVYLDIYNFIEL